MTVIRRPGTASATLLVGFTVSVFAAHLVAPEWSRRAGLDVWNLAEAERAHQSAVEDRAELNLTEQRLLRRIEAADHVALRLAAGDLALPAAADELAALYREQHAAVAALELHHADVTDRRRLFALHAIERATRLLEGDPPRRAAVLARLEREYHGMSGVISEQ